ncbi:hypothetical protein [Helicobacter sp. T3_23-1056]
MATDTNRQNETKSRWGKFKSVLQTMWDRNKSNVYRVKNVFSSNNKTIFLRGIEGSGKTTIKNLLCDNESELKTQKATNEPVGKFYAPDSVIVDTKGSNDVNDIKDNELGNLIQKAKDKKHNICLVYVFDASKYWGMPEKQKGAIPFLYNIAKQKNIGFYVVGTHLDKLGNSIEKEKNEQDIRQDEKENIILQIIQKECGDKSNISDIKIEIFDFSSDKDFKEKQKDLKEFLRINT